MTHALMLAALWALHRPSPLSKKRAAAVGEVDEGAFGIENQNHYAIK